MEKGSDMMTRKGTKFATGCKAALAATTALALLAVAPTTAANAGGSAQMTASGGSATATDFSAARRHRHYHRGGGAAAAAAFAGIVGTIGAIAPTQARRDAYYDSYAYDAPYAYGGGPYYGYYGGGPYYRGYGPSRRIDGGGNIIP